MGQYVTNPNILRKSPLTFIGVTPSLYDTATSHPAPTRPRTRVGQTAGTRGFVSAVSLSEGNPRMHTQTTASPTRSQPPETLVSTAEVQATAPGGIRVIRRNGKLTSFDASKISLAVNKAFLAVEGGVRATSAAAARCISRTSRTRSSWR